MGLFDDQPAWVEEQKEQVDAILALYPDRRSALMPLLHLAQEVRGYIDAADIAAVAGLIEQTPAYVESVCSFYAMYHRHPVGKYLLLFCNNAACAVMGGKQALAALKAKLGIPGDKGTTPDGLITLEATHECLANCDGGPCLQVNGQYVIKLTPDKVDALVDDLRAGKGPDAHLEKGFSTGYMATVDPEGNPLPAAAYAGPHREGALVPPPPAPEPAGDAGSAGQGGEGQ